MSYRVDDSPQGLETAPHGKHVLDGVRNGRELEKEKSDPEIKTFSGDCEEKKKNRSDETK